MKISLANFKAIKNLNEFQIKPMTILSGTNSTGKSSFIQFLLLIKQTLELDSSSIQMALNGEYYDVREFLDLVSGKSIAKNIMAEFIFEKQELIGLESRLEVFDALNYTSKVRFEYQLYNGKPYISNFSLNYYVEGDQKKDGQFVSFNSEFGRKNKFTINTNNELFVKNIWNSDVNVERINYSGIYPMSYDVIEIVTGKSPSGGTIKDSKKARYFSNLESVKEKLDSFFENISYIGPLRDSPKDVYSIRGKHKSVGSKGENVAAVLEDRKKDIIKFSRPKFTESGVEYIDEEISLLQAVSFWICDVFQLGKEIRSTKVEDSYSIVIINNSGIESTIKHVGFGVSQILPIVVEGLILTNNSTLILEQPEIHLHPKIQSFLFDFLRSLTLKGVRVLIETHSDHFITRLRRRIAEDASNTLPEEINLTFIETIKNEILFRTILLDDNGALEYFPIDFMEQANIETKAILKAQIKKKINK